jgi:hypothetical protein
MTETTVSVAEPQALAPDFEVYDGAFEVVLGRYARLTKVAEADAHEGPVYVRSENALYFTTVPRVSGRPRPGTLRAAIKRLVLDGPGLPADPSRHRPAPPGDRPAHPGVAPGLVVDKVYVGYWFWGRPSPFQLWEDLQDLLRRTKADFDPTTEQARADWMAANVAQLAGG